MNAERGSRAVDSSPEVGLRLSAREILLDPVKMVVWDLDETFWSGTISEGPVVLDPSRIELIRSLNRRGIVNSICSKNDLVQVRQRLDEAGLWEEFVFASVEWAPKGSRVARIIEDAQLRAENILMIDDSPLNLEEARHAAPGIQTAGPEIIDRLLSFPELQGKDDAGLTRLHQYQVLERKLTDRESAAGGNDEFLRSCGIRIGIFEDCDGETDRLFELVNRTNQLNFTKRRPEAGEFEELLKDPNRRTGYVRVRDRYGDYGICGFYALSSDGETLTDFLFSCRVLHMGVEQWVYDRIGHPALEVVGEVVSSLGGQVDWITEDVTGFDEEAGDGPAKSPSANPDDGRVLMVGGCDLIAVAQFLGGNIETDFTRNGLTGALIHSEHTDLLRQAAAGVTEDQLAVVDRLPFLDRKVFEPAVLSDQFDVVIYSLLMDYTQGRYRHRATGLVIPWHQHDQDATDSAFWPRVEAKFGRVGIDTEFLTWFANEFECVGPISVDEFKSNLTWLTEQMPQTEIIFINAVEFAIDNPGEPERHLHHRDMNAALDSVVESLDRARVCDVRTIVTSREDLSKKDLRHYHRHVYKGIAEQIRSFGVAKAIVAIEPPAERSNGSERPWWQTTRSGRYVRRTGSRLVRRWRTSRR
jgi:FkbH-like protein